MGGLIFVICIDEVGGFYTSSYKADFGFSVFMNRLKNLSFSRPSGLKSKEMLQRWFRNQKGSCQGHSRRDLLVYYSTDSLEI